MNTSSAYNQDVVELKYFELENIDGGFWGGVAQSLVASAIWAAGSYIYNHAPSYHDVINHESYSTPIA